MVVYTSSMETMTFSRYSCLQNPCDISVTTIIFFSKSIFNWILLLNWYYDFVYDYHDDNIINLLHNGRVFYQSGCQLLKYSPVFFFLFGDTKQIVLAFRWNLIDKVSTTWVLANGVMNLRIHHIRVEIFIMLGNQETE